MNAQKCGHGNAGAGRIWKSDHVPDARTGLSSRNIYWARPQLKRPGDDHLCADRDRSGFHAKTMTERLREPGAGRSTLEAASFTETPNIPALHSGRQGSSKCCRQALYSDNPTSLLSLAQQLEKVHGGCSRKCA